MSDCTSVHYSLFVSKTNLYLLFIIHGENKIDRKNIYSLFLIALYIETIKCFSIFSTMNDCLRSESTFL